MQALQARIDSFQKSKRVKRYPHKPSSQTTSLKWPHPPSFRANPNTLAEAGFFFSPSWDDRDSVACFLCGKELSDWDADDDPFQIHYTKCQSSCAWAAVRCGLFEDIDDKGSFVFNDKTRLPLSKKMEKARLDTFGTDWWPHDDEPGHSATSTKMAQAGFIYNPQAAGDDTVTCLYCNLSLGGWEEDDDPIQEHRTRDNKSGNACPFLALSSKSTRSRPVQPNVPVKKPPAVKAEQLSDDELAAIEVTGPPPPRAKRGKARSTTATATTKSRRKTRTMRGKSAKASAPPARHSPSPSQVIASHVPHDTSPPPSRHSPPPTRMTAPHQPDETVPDASPMDTDDVPPECIPEPQLEPVTGPPPPSLRSDSHQDSGVGSVRSNSSAHSLPDQPATPALSPPHKPDNSPPPDVTVKNPDPIISLSPAGQPTIANAKPLTDDERAMTLEQWIRHEINVSYERLMIDGKRQIELFKTRAAELRTCIDEL